MRSNLKKITQSILLYFMKKLVYLQLQSLIL